MVSPPRNNSPHSVFAMVTIRLKGCVRRSIATFCQFLPILPALLAPFGLLYTLNTLHYTSKVPVKLHVHLSDDIYIRNVLHTIDMPSADPYGEDTTQEGPDPEEEERLAVKRLGPYIKPELERLTKGSTPEQKQQYRQYLRNLDIMSLRLTKFSRKYKNPCWKQESRHRVSCPFVNVKNLKQTASGSSNTLRCLPYFVIIGQPKCGTTAIYNHLAKHPDVTLSKNKEPYWLNRRRFVKQCASLSTYSDLFHENAYDIESNFIKNATTQEVFHPMITGDGSVDIMWDNHLWRDLPRNRKCSEPCYTNADYLHHINPNTRIVVAFRDPVERLYSDYMFEHLYLKYSPDKLDFHKRIIESLYKFRICLKKNSLRFCVYDPTLESTLSKVRPLIGLYHVHLEDWLRLFPRDRIHVIRFEDYVNNTQHELENLFKFLSLRGLSEREMRVVMRGNNTNRRPKSSRDQGDMSEESRELLQQFYLPYNQRLAALLNDTRFLWKDTYRNTL